MRPKAASLLKMRANKQPSIVTRPAIAGSANTIVLNWRNVVAIMHGSKQRKSAAISNLGFA